MALSSMTGFARAEGTSAIATWAWEIKSVNAKGLDVKLRLPGGLEAAEPEMRRRIAEKVTRGSLFASLTVKREGPSSAVRINQEVLDQVIGALGLVAARIDVRPPSVDGLLAIRGVVDVVEPEETAEERQALQEAVLAGLDRALDALHVMRGQEGAALGQILAGRLSEIERLTEAAETHPARRPEAIKAKLARSIETLLDTGASFDADRLHQEALLLASKADIREELDRLVAHVAAARKLLAEGGSVGRKLDFLAQEFNRETNTLCSKANDLSLTGIGLDLKAVVEQFREQVQNLE